ncbi:hypothetical protein [Mucilaginibacter metallidurans]|uniref:hypothetical protein n=1 Tax=Mucilaginibacter sp. P4 TaxID=3383180 RepID=UPI003899C1EC
MIKRALDHHKNKISKAAAALGSRAAPCTGGSKNTRSRTMKLRTKYILFVVILHLLTWCLLILFSTITRSILSYRRWL